MRYKPELGFFGNLERVFSELNKTNGKVFNTENTASNTKEVVAAQLGEESLQNAEQFRRAVQMLAVAIPDSQAMEIATVFDAWAPGRRCKAWEFISFGTNGVGDPQLYQVITDHIAQEDWPPDLTKSLYRAIGLDDSGHPVWSRPSGAHDAYNVDDVVNYNGILYRSLIDGNVYAPDEYPAGWEVVTE